MSGTSQTLLRQVPLAAWWVLALMTVDYVLGMIDRNAVSILKTTLKGEFGIGDAEYSLVVTAFLVPYAIFYVICGRLVDRFGTRMMFTLFVTLWSVATIAAGLSRSFPELVLWRVVLGAAEAGLVPATITALVTWFPRDRLATIYAIKNPLQALGPILSPPLIAGLALAFGWRAAFIAPGALGLVFAALWWFADRNPPTYAAAASAAAPAENKAGSGLVALLRHPLLWGVLLARLVSDPVWFFFQNWQAGYLQEELGWSLGALGRLLWVPPLLTVLLTFVTAGVSDRLVAKGWWAGKSRIRVMQATAIFSPLIAILPLLHDVGPVIAVLATTYFLGFTWLAFCNLLVADVFPKHQVGAAVGVVNAVGTVGAAIFNAGVGGWIEAQGYAPVFLTLALLHPAAAVIMQVFYGGRFRRNAMAGA